jgi:hypothetical protein
VSELIKALHEWGTKNDFADGSQTVREGTPFELISEPGTAAVAVNGWVLLVVPGECALPFAPVLEPAFRAGLAGYAWELPGEPVEVDGDALRDFCGAPDWFDDVALSHGYEEWDVEELVRRGYILGIALNLRLLAQALCAFPPSGTYTLRAHHEPPRRTRLHVTGDGWWAVVMARCEEGERALWTEDTPRFEAAVPA